MTGARGTRTTGLSWRMPPRICRRMDPTVTLRGNLCGIPQPLSGILRYRASLATRVQSWATQIEGLTFTLYPILVGGVLLSARLDDIRAVVLSRREE